MLPFFLDPYPDEILYSLFSRLRERLGPLHPNVLADWLYGRIYITAVGLPGHMGDFMKQLPNGHPFTVNDFIQRNTLFPYYTAFFPPERSTELRERIVGSTKGLYKGYLGRLHDFNLRYCSDCIEEDRQQWGETYWHRVHQIPEVRVCPRHGSILSESEFPATGSGRRFTSAEEAVSSTKGRTLDIPYPEHDLHRALAKDAEWLLNQSNLNVGPDALQRAYLRILRERGLARRHVSRASLNELIDARYPAGLLLELGIPVETGRYAWPQRLLHGGGIPHATVKHLVFFHVLGFAARQFVKSELTKSMENTSRSSFGAGPWLCLNPVADHYQQPVILEIKLGRTETGKDKATFRCECGFHYERYGPATSADAQCWDRIVNFGPVFDNQFRLLWMDGRLSVEEIGRRLGLTPWVVERQAERLGLSNHRVDGPKSRPLKKTTEKLLQSRDWVTRFRTLWNNPDLTVHGITKVIGLGHRTVRRLAVELNLPVPKPAGESTRPQFGAKVSARREAWIQVMKSSDGSLLRSELRHKHPGLFNWLWKHDRDWFDQHSPSPTKFKAEWQERDKKWAELVPQIAKELRSLQPAVRVTRCGIGDKLGSRFHLTHHVDRLPRTMEAIANHVESWEEFGIRRVGWAVEELRQQGIVPTNRRVIVKAGLSDAILQHSGVVQAIKRALRSD